jgi:hypothetical protein
LILRTGAGTLTMLPWAALKNKTEKETVDSEYKKPRTTIIKTLAI